MTVGNRIGIMISSPAERVDKGLTKYFRAAVDGNHHARVADTPSLAATSCLQPHRSWF